MKRLLPTLLLLLRKDNTQVLIGNLIASAFGLGTFMVLARSMTQADFGQWALFISLLGLLDLMKTGLIRQSYVRAITVETNSERLQVITASAWVIALASTLLLSGMIWIICLWVPDDNSMYLFFKYYPLLGILSLPYHMDTWQSHAEGRFRRMNGLRMWLNMLFMAFVLVAGYFRLSVSHVMWGFIGCHGIISAFSFRKCIFKIHLRFSEWHQIKSLLHYGKHSISTLTGSNLLKSADTLIIGWMMGTEAVAIYAVPLKLLDLMEIPLRGFLMTSFRKLSILHEQQNTAQFKKLILGLIGKITLAFIPFGLLMAIFPEWVIRLIGGSGYNESFGLLPVFVIIMMLLPLDKFVGIAFDSINKPGMNASKVWLMVVINLVGDYLAIVFIGELWAVAGVTLVNIAIGIAFGWWQHPYFRKRLEPQPT